MKVTIIGAGSMGGTAAISFSKSSLFSPDDITITAQHQETLDGFKGTNIHTSLDNKEAIKNADLIIIAVRPSSVRDVCLEISPFINRHNQIIINFAAGISSEQLKDWFTYENYRLPYIFLAMPNTAMELNEGLTFLSPVNVKPIHTALVKAIFDSVGKTLVVEENMINAGMALASSGLAYAMKYILASVHGGTSMGFSREDAIKIVLQTVKGASMLIHEHETDPEDEIAKIATPEGYTIKGLRVMEDSDFTEVVIKALDACSK